jgi:hypothetical protein
MSSKFLIPLCASLALLGACSDRNEATGTGAADNATDAAGDTTPATPSTPADMPPADTPPSDTMPPAETPPAETTPPAPGG